MLTKEISDLLTQTGPGTPGGELMRRYWQPAALSEELPPGGAPVPIRLLGEDLVLFRDDQGRPGLLALHCSHRGADLSYGRTEDGGLRCIYHGWLYDIEGRCLEQPGEPSNSWTYSGARDSMQTSTLEAQTEALSRPFRDKIHHPAYPCREMGGLILTYMGPGDPPLVPGFEFLRAPDKYRHVTKLFHECNYQQANEGNVDPQHSSFLHRAMSRDRVSMSYLAGDGAPIIDWEETEYGVRVYSVRRVGNDRNYARITYFIMPNLSAFGGMWPDGYQVNWHVPIDDEHHWKYVITFSRTTPLDKEEISESGFFMTPDYRPLSNKANRYNQDRESMANGFFAGLGADFYDHDLWATEGQGPIMDRTQEHLGYTDRPVVAARNVLLRAILRLQKGIEPPLVARQPGDSPLVDIIVQAETIPSSMDWRTQWEKRPVTEEARAWPL